MKKMKTGAIILMVTTGITNATAQIIEKKIDITKSTIIWKAYKVAGSHTGTINLKEGTLLFTNKDLTGGTFVVTMNTINDTDLNGESKNKLETHLKSDDFFGVEKHPNASMIFKKVTTKSENVYTVTADLTIKNKTNPVTFDISIYDTKATASVKIDRSKYDVRYGSGSFFDNLGDKVIYDEFDLVVDLQF